MEEEKKLFEELEPLINEYIEYSKQEMPDEWYDKRATARIERESRQYPEGREGDILKALDDEELGKPQQDRKILIEELKQIREEKSQAKQEVIYNKAKEFIDSNKEKMNKEIEEKSQKLEKAKNAKEAAKKSQEKAYKIRNLVKKEAGKDSKVYVVANEEAKETLKKLTALSKEYNIARKELKQAQGNLAEFEEKYNEIDFASETGIYNLLDMIGLEEEKETSRMSDGQVYGDNNSKIDDMEEIKKMQKAAIVEEEAKKAEAQKAKAEEEKNTEAEARKLEEKAKREYAEKIFAKMEKGYEDLLADDYLKRKEIILNKYTLEEIKDCMEGKTLLDIYKEELKYVDKESPERKEIEELISKIEQRNAELDKKQQTKPTQTKPTQTKPTQTKPTQTKPTQTNRDTGFKTTDFIVDLTHDSIILNLEGATRSYIIDNVSERIKDAKEIKKEYKYNKDNSLYALGIKKSDPLIIAALETIDKERGTNTELLRQDYINSFVNASNLIDSVTYVFGDKDKELYDNKTYKQLKKFAKDAEKFQGAQIKGLEEKSLWEKFQDWRQARKVKRIAAKSEKEEKVKPENGERKQTENKDSKKTFNKELQKGAPTQKQQAKKAKEFKKNEQIVKREPIVREDLESTITK